MSLGRRKLHFIIIDGDTVINYAALDAPIDQLIWQRIADSPCPEDFHNYLRHAPEGAAHMEEAIDRLIALDDADASCTAGELRDARGQYELAMLYAEGNGLERNLPEARKWLEKAAAQGDDDAVKWMVAHDARKKGEWQ